MIDLLLLGRVIGLISVELNELNEFIDLVD